MLTERALSTRSSAVHAQQRCGSRALARLASQEAGAVGKICTDFLDQNGPFLQPPSGLSLYSPFRAFEFFSHGTELKKEPLYSDFRVKTNSFPPGTKLLPRRERFCVGTKFSLEFLAVSCKDANHSESQSVARVCEAQAFLTDAV